MIILIRHATPVVNYERCSSAVAVARLQEYNTTKNIQHQEIEAFKVSAFFKDLQLKKLKIYSSPTNRAIETAKCLFSENEFEILQELTEYDLRVLCMPLIHLSLRTWFAISRIAWLLGYANKATDKKTEFERTERIYERFATELKQSSCEHQVIVSHGFFLGKLGLKLKKEGWTKKRIHKDGCFLVEVYEL